jgi:hypothetical protein
VVATGRVFRHIQPEAQGARCKVQGARRKAALLRRNQKGRRRCHGEERPGPALLVSSLWQHPAGARLKIHLIFFSWGLGGGEPCAKPRMVWLGPIFGELAAQRPPFDSLMQGGPLAGYLGAALVPPHVTMACWVHTTQVHSTHTRQLPSSRPLACPSPQLNSSVRSIALHLTTSSHLVSAHVGASTSTHPSQRQRPTAPISLVGLTFSPVDAGQYKH